VSAYQSFSPTFALAIRGVLVLSFFAILLTVAGETRNCRPISRIEWFASFKRASIEVIIFGEMSFALPMAGQIFFNAQKYFFSF
jgi:hypothetical protein